MAAWLGGGSDELDVDDAYDTLLLERSWPREENEISLIEAICHAATPGPLVPEGEADTAGTLVATLPDGRRIVSSASPASGGLDAETIHANARLICRARYWLLSLLRERRRWLAEREALLERLGERPSPAASSIAPPHRRPR